VSLLDGLLPPPGAPGVVRVGADRWRQAADRLHGVENELRSRSAVLTASWLGPARAAFDGQTGGVLDAVASAVGLLRRYAEVLDDLADGIERAQDEYHQRIGMVVGTAVVGGLLTAVTATVSDEVAAGAVTAEMAAVTGIATTAAEQAVALLSSLAAQAAALAARWAVFAGVAMAADGASGMIVHRDADPFAYVHWADDAELGLIGAVAVPLSAALTSGIGHLGGAALSAGAAGIVSRLAAAGVATAGADGLVRAALRQGIDPGELAMAVLPFGRAGRRPLPGIASEGTVPLGFATTEEFVAFGAELKKGLADAGYRDAVPVFQGSAVTGVKYTTGELFDVGRRSDFDIAVADPRLFEDAKRAGVRIRSGGTRTAPLELRQLESLGMGDLVHKLAQQVDRDVHVMIYRDLLAALQRAGGLRLR
jgi:uncharacterized protein YukE